MAFGDIKAALLLEVVKALIMKKGPTVDKHAANQLADSTEVDDSASGGTWKDVQTMASSKDEPGSIAQILELGGFTANNYN